MVMCRRSMDYRPLPLVDSHRRGRSNQRCCAGRLNVSIFGLGILLGIQWASRRGGGLPGFNLKECKCVGDSNSSATQGIMLQMGVTREVSRALENQDSNVKKSNLRLKTTQKENSTTPSSLSQNATRRINYTDQQQIHTLYSQTHSCVDPERCEA
jgi:hypothetical protein